MKEIWIYYYPGTGDHLFPLKVINLDVGAVIAAAALLAILVNRLTVWYGRGRHR